MSWICLSFLRLYLFSLQSSVFLTILILLLLFYIVDVATISINFRLSAIIVVGKVFTPPSRSYRRESVDEEYLPLSRQAKPETWDAAALRPEGFTITVIALLLISALGYPSLFGSIHPRLFHEGRWRINFYLVENFMKPGTTPNVFLTSSLSLGIVFIVLITAYS